jgi:hypothetical protein
MKNWEERALEKRLDPYSYAYVTFNCFYKFMAEYGHQWSRNIDPQHDEKFE